MLSAACPFPSAPNLTHLNLNFNILEAIEFNKEHSTIKKLFLRKNRLSHIPSLGNLQSLQVLDCSANSISDIGFLSGLTNLVSLDLSENEIEDISILASLPNLTYLNIKSNRITDISPIAGIQSLKFIDLTNNFVSNATALRNLENLEEIRLGHNRVTDLSILQNLKKIRLLDLRDNGIDEFPSFPSLENIVYLDLCGNALGEISALSSLTRLEFLDISRTNINNISPLTNLTSLKFLDISDNNVADLLPIRTIIAKGIPVKQSTYSYRVNYEDAIVLGSNPFTNPPVEIALQGNKAILNYFEEIVVQGKDYLYEAKLLIVGEGGVGKTTLAKKIIDIDSPLPEQDYTTRGITVEPHTFIRNDGNGTFKMNIWDFGGQQIYHTTHQFFLTKRSLYVLMTDSRRENDNFSYWLNVIELFSASSPIVILQNVHQDRTREFDEKSIISRFNVKGFFKLSLKDDPKKTAVFVKELEHQIQQLEHIGEELPKQWVKIRKALEQISLTKNFISKDDYLKICEENEIVNFERALFLSRYLHDLGVILHFQSEPALDDWIILQNTWATEAVYRVHDFPKEKEKGRFNSSDFEHIWNEDPDETDPDKRKRNREYARKRSYLLALMMKFEMCYKVQDKDLYIVPMLLPKNEPEIPSVTGITIRYSYDFMPKGITSRLTVRMHRFITNQSLVWATGVFLNENTASALIKETFEGREIQIIASGFNAKSLLTKIIYELDMIHSTFERLKVKKLIPCNCKTCTKAATPHFFDYEDLERRLFNKRETVECSKSYQVMNVKLLLEDAGVGDASSAGAVKPQKRKVFLSYSHKDEDFKDKLDVHLAPLKRSESIDVWNDRKIGPGQNWDATIRREIEEADIILLLISANFNNSLYILKTELDSAIKKHNQATALIVPVFIKECDFSGMPYEGIQGIPRDAKFIGNFTEREQDKLFAEVSRELRKIIINE
ncbi:MAG TPA: COR domain-containing protein [Puia sp.]|nr:COR domain-containing protein [Puia sp.]